MDVIIVSGGLRRQSTIFGERNVTHFENDRLTSNQTREN